MMTRQDAIEPVDETNVADDSELVRPNDLLSEANDESAEEDDQDDEMDEEDDAKTDID